MFLLSLEKGYTLKSFRPSFFEIGPVVLEKRAMQKIVRRQRRQI